MKVEVVGKNENGTPHLLYTPDDPGAHVLYTGPIKGQVTTTDGTTYNVDADWIEVSSLAHAGEISHLIGMRHESEGHPLHTDGVPFVHICTDHCGALAISAKKKVDE